MSEPSNDNTSTWLSWITAGGAIFTLLWAIAKRFFSFVSREEVMQMHRENQAVMARMDERLDKLVEDVAYLRGRDQ